MFSNHVQIQCAKDGHPYLNRDPDIFKLLVNYLRNDSEEFPILDPTQQYLFDKELKFWGLNDITLKLEKRLVEMMKSEPVLNPDGTQTPLEVWKKLGPLDLNEVHHNNPIDLSPDLVYREVEDKIGMGFG